jgi:transposase-like protein
LIKDLATEIQGTTMGDLERSGGERSEALRSGGSPMVERRSSGPGEKVPDPEVVARPKRRQFTAEYKLRILREADACKGSGEIGALLRREGLYSSHLVLWRRQREQAAHTELKSRKRGPKPKAQDPRVKQLEREKARLERRLKHAETIIEIQKKVHELLGIPLKNLDSDEND